MRARRSLASLARYAPSVQSPPGSDSGELPARSGAAFHSGRSGFRQLPFRRSAGRTRSNPPRNGRSSSAGKSSVDVESFQSTGSGRSAPGLPRWRAEVRAVAPEMCWPPGRKCVPQHAAYCCSRCSVTVRGRMHFHFYVDDQATFPLPAVNSRAFARSPGNGTLKKIELAISLRRRHR